MKSQAWGLRVASVIFGLISIAQLMRLVMRLAIVVEGRAVPLWPSMLAFMIMGGLSFWLWKLARMKTE
ncbi:MAG: hypothetical protein A4E65_00829 [Syntrophorhabdus sp. PtaU1.Bin153]|nr:MAG: hypothetical protein A4E65_00829 [Syntrophorhabdus sp. PtaU1.Bin153]